jgi:hypothetical protein
VGWVLILFADPGFQHMTLPRRLIVIAVSAAAASAPLAIRAMARAASGGSRSASRYSGSRSASRYSGSRSASRSSGYPRGY